VLDRPSWRLGIRRGLAGRCPACGEGRLFRRFLKVADRCEACGTELHHHRADDMPPYVVIFIAAKAIGLGVYWTETMDNPPEAWVSIAIWLAATIVLCLALIQPIKGAVVGLQYSLGMHGFGERAGDHGETRGDGSGADAHGPAHRDGA